MDSQTGTDHVCSSGMPSHTDCKGNMFDADCNIAAFMADTLLLRTHCILVWYWKGSCFSWKKTEQGRDRNNMAGQTCMNMWCKQWHVIFDIPFLRAKLRPDIKSQSDYVAQWTHV